MGINAGSSDAGINTTKTAGKKAKDAASEGLRKDRVLKVQYSDICYHDSS